MPAKKNPPDIKTINNPTERFAKKNAFTFLYSPLPPDESDLFKSFYKEIKIIDSSKVLTKLHGQEIKVWDLLSLQRS